jgi:hypothetical protein
MALQMACQIAPLLDVGRRKEATSSERGVKNGGGVPFAQDEPVTFGPIGTGRIEVELVEEAGGR